MSGKQNVDYKDLCQTIVNLNAKCWVRDCDKDGMVFKILKKDLNKLPEDEHGTYVPTSDNKRLAPLQLPAGRIETFFKDQKTRSHWINAADLAERKYMKNTESTENMTASETVLIENENVIIDEKIETVLSNLDFSSIDQIRMALKEMSDFLKNNPYLKKMGFKKNINKASEGAVRAIEFLDNAIITSDHNDAVVSNFNNEDLADELMSILPNNGEFIKNGDISKKLSWANDLDLLWKVVEHLSSRNLIKRGRGRGGRICKNIGQQINDN